MVKPNSARLPLLAALWVLIVGGAVVAGPPVAAAPGTTVAVTPLTVFPTFDEAVYDYALRCAAGSNDVTVNVVAPTATSIAVNGASAASGVDTAVSIDEDDLITVAVTVAAVTEEYFYRCLPSDFPEYTVDKPGSPEPGFYLMAFGLCINACPTTGGSFIALVDTNGVPVWYKRTRLPVVDQKIRSDGQLAFYEFDLTAPRDAALRLLEDPLREAYQINSFDGSFDKLIRADGLSTDLHELLELENGNDLLISYVDNVRYDPVIDGYIQELDAAGDAVWEWRSQFEISDDENLIPTSNDIVHLNSVDEFPGGDLLVSGRSVGVYKIDRATGDVIWKLGGTDIGAKSLTIIGDGTYDPPDGPARQHDARVLDDGSIFMYDNRVPGEAARVVNYVIDDSDPDPTNWTATLVWEHQHPTGNSSPFIGSARRQPVLGTTGSAAGNTVIDWGGTQPILDEVDFAGVRQFAISGSGEAQYRAVKYPPTTFTGALDIDTLRGFAGGLFEYDAPTDVTADPGHQQATVSWTAPTAGGPVTGYTVTARTVASSLRAAPWSACADAIDLSCAAREASGSISLGCTTTGETSCVVTGLTTGETYEFIVEADNSNGKSLASLPSGMVTIPDPVFVPVSPFRLEDTRQVGGQRVGSADGTAPPLQFNVLGRGGLPASGVGAVSLNVTVDRGGLPNVGGGFVTVDGCESPRPTASNLNFGAGQTVPNAVLTPVSPTGDVCVYVYGTADILVDVNGYFPEVSDFTPVSPFRLEDTRQVGGQRVGSADGTAPPLQFNVLGRGGLPASGVGAVSLNVTVDRGGLPNVGGGFVTVDGCESPRPTASNLNFGAGQTVPNAVLTPVSPTGDVCVYVYGTADILVDVNGYFPEVSDFTPVSPFRLEDTRQVGGQRVGSADGTAPPLQFNVLGRGGLPASGVGAVSLNVTVDRGGLPNVGGGFVTVDGCESPRPTASNLNFGAGQTVPNAVLTPVSPTGDVCVYVYGTADILVDVNGYFPD